MKFIAALLTVLLFVVVVATLLALPTMWAWNEVVPRVFKLPAIGFLDAFCLNFLAGVFFKSTSSSD